VLKCFSHDYGFTLIREAATLALSTISSIGVSIVSLTNATLLEVGLPKILKSVLGRQAIFLIQ
jgi:hypothetical protein